MGLPFGYKAAKEQADMESYEVMERKTKARRKEVLKALFPR